ncbi:MAG: 2-amino-4-hydroxy-6-hydroxymethyldihydropteridine diphosphokinase [Prevotellaceae bacterium]|nr:2-amino-4-hydroxy-6-hydroxymethyldihydropteridine diphosphokinase [Prevotellaceae bacterium]
MAYLGLGSNLGNKSENLRQAIEQIEKQVGTVVSRSAFYHTEPWGYQSEHAFVNAVLAVRTTLTPFQLLQRTQEIERQLGRTEKTRSGQVYADRLIDIDILFYDDIVLCTPELVIPHPRIAERPFVLQPLTEIASEYVHPSYQETIAALYRK